MKTVESVTSLPTLAVQAAGLLRARSAAGRRPELAPETSVKNTNFPLRVCVEYGTAMLYVYREQQMHDKLSKGDER